MIEDFKPKPTELRWQMCQWQLINHDTLIYEGHYQNVLSEIIALHSISRNVEPKLRVEYVTPASVWVAPFKYWCWFITEIRKQRDKLNEIITNQKKGYERRYSN